MVLRSAEGAGCAMTDTASLQRCGVLKDLFFVSSSCLGAFKRGVCQAWQRRNSFGTS